MSVNKAILIGNLGKDPEIRYTQSGDPVANFTIATSEQWTGKDGQRQERTEWHNIVVFRRQAETCKQYLAKGRKVYIEGRIQTRKWTDQNNQTRYTTEIVADNVQFLGGRNEGAQRPAQQGGWDQGGAPQAAPQQGGWNQGGGAPAPAAPQPAAPAPAGGGHFDDGDIPF